MNIRLSRAVHGGRRCEFADKYGLNSDNVIDFSVNINFLGPSAKAISAIKSSFDKIETYPDNGADELKKSLSTYLGVDQTNILPGNGSIELIYLVIAAYRPRKVVIVAPTFTEYEQAAKINGAEVINVYLDDNFQNLSAAYDTTSLSEAELIFICNPNNPSGALFNIADIERISLSFPRATVVIDEAFMDFIDQQRDYSLTLKAATNPRLIVLRSLGKFFALAGLRLGYLIACKETAEFLALRQPPWHINNFAIAAAAASINDKEYIADSKVTYRLSRDNFYQRLTSINGLKVYPTHANFFLIKIKQSDLNAYRLQDELAANNILIRVAADFKGLNDSYFRVAVRNKVDNRLLADKLGEILA